ncbi:MAG: hypothetical protein IJV40_14060 [Oscillospiraceae bacterium]|nr:hypothetical protein [Oscillospiraceae bacterium]
MYCIDSGFKDINGGHVNTFIRGIAGRSALLEVEAGTNGYKGGNRQKGSRTYFRLTALNNTDFYARVHNNSRGQPDAVEICFCGDEGIDVFLRALDFARSAISDQARDVCD